MKELEKRDKVVVVGLIIVLLFIIINIMKIYGVKTD